MLYGQPGCLGSLFDGGCRQPPAPPGASIGLGVHHGHVGAGVEQCVQGAGGKRRRAGESQAKFVQGEHGGGRTQARLALAFEEFFADALALEVGQIVHKQLSFQVIALVLNAHGQQAVSLEFEVVAIAVEGGYADAFQPGDVVELSRHRQAAFLVGDFLRVEVNEFRIYEGDRLTLVLGNVDHDDALVHVNLSGREANARRGVHGFKQVVDQPAHGVVHLAHGLGPGAQAGVGVFQYVEQGHVILNVETSQEPVTCLYVLLGFSLLRL